MSGIILFSLTTLQTFLTETSCLGSKIRCPQINPDRKKPSPGRVALEQQKRRQNTDHQGHESRGTEGDAEILLH